MAAFFHDVEYNVKKPSDVTNVISDEELSAMYANNALKQIGFDDDFINDVSNLILLTQLHKVNNSINIDPLLQSIFIDADMAILGEEPFLYTQYSDAIREEYKNINPETFILGRKNFLSKINKHKTIFLTEYMNELYNDQAHSNIENEIKDLNRLYVELLTAPEEV
jgi:predicted metal-dependent HD superfamily phosphohydrolase